MTPDDAALSESVRRLWGLTPSPAKGQRPGLTVERVIEAAVVVADTDGLEAVSMSRVASELGFTTMALYRHVASKDELLELMRDAASGDPPELPHDDGWRAAITAWTWGQVGIVDRHPWFAQMTITGPPIAPNQVAWMEAGLSALRDSGLRPDERFALIAILSGYVLHEVRFTQELAQHHEGRTPADIEGTYGRQLAAVADPDRFPELSAVLATGVFEIDETADHDGHDPSFTFGLELMLDGVEQLVQRRRARPSRSSSTRPRRQ